ncbi:MAG: hypothetical protein AAF702_50655, partial [Chloroflexota bacterium]
HRASITHISFYVNFFVPALRVPNSIPEPLSANWLCESTRVILYFPILLENEDYFNEDDLGFGGDVEIVVYGPKPISQHEANVFYRAVLDYEAELEAKKHRKTA